jgi:uncharacterized protein (DUF849 family)
LTVTTYTPLPDVMVAPNGARRLKTDHPAIPVTDKETVETAIACQIAGADGIHIHLRDNAGRHLLDATRYRELLKDLEGAVPRMFLQVTSEAAGIYDAATQQAMVRGLKPRHVSVAMREMVRRDPDWSTATEFYAWALANDVQIQHILYSPKELATFLNAADHGKIPGDLFQLQFVLGTYDGTEISDPSNLAQFLDLLHGAPSQMEFDWMLCAFGKEETDCLVQAVRDGGKVRVGFENSLWNKDGSMARDNAERVREVVVAS